MDTITYTITLLNTIFDKENDNVLLCNSKQELQAYIDTITDKVIVATNINFDVNDLITTSVVVDVPIGLSFLKLLNYNYCMVKNNVDPTDISYWFINNSKQDVANRIRLDLQIDWFNTYWYDINNMQGLIVRTHLDRFIKHNNQYVYNFALNSPFFEREKIQGLAKRPTKKFKLLSHYDTASMDSKLDNWLNNNIECWKYYFLSAGKEYQFYRSNNGIIDENISTSTLRELKYNNETNSGVVVLCEPVYKYRRTGGYIFFKNTKSNNQYWWLDSGINQFLKDNNNYANVFAIKLSNISPFAIGLYVENTDYQVDNNNLYILSNNSDYFGRGIDGEYYIYNSKLTQYPYPIMQVVSQNLTKNLIMSIPSEMYQCKFNIDEINNKCEPKLYNEDYAIYRLYFGGNQYELPVAKSSNKPYFIYKEIIAPDITKSILIFNSTNENDETNTYFSTIYNNLSEKDFTGFISTIDNSLWFTNDQLDTFLATNKNNLQIFQNQQKSRASQTATNMVGSVVTGITSSLATSSPIGAVSGSVQAISQGINTAIQTAYDSINYDLTIDNMRNAPQELQSLNSNALLISAVDEFGIYIELQQLIPFEQQQIVDYLNIFGYTYNNIADVKSLVKSRKYYNYIQANVFDIDGRIAEQLKDIIKESIAKGIRLWHKDNFNGIIDFKLNNIERSIVANE